MRINFGPGLVLQPGDLLWVDISATVLPTVAAGTVLCNTSSTRACNKNDNKPTQVSEANVCFTVKPYKPDCCPKEAEISVQLLPGVQLTNMGSYTLLQAAFNLMASPYPIQEVRVSITDKNITYQPDAACVQCYTKYQYLGTFAQPQTALGTLLLNGTGAPYLVINKEIVYKPGAPMLLTPAQQLGVNILLPDLNNIPCCKVEGDICLKFVFKDINCNYCERVVCLPVNYDGQLPGPINPVILGNGGPTQK